MAESLDDGEFWLPPKFLTDDDIVKEKHGSGNLKNSGDWFGSDAEAARVLFPFEFPYGVGSFGVSSDLSSPVESVVGSTETESDEDDFIAGLTRKMVHSTIDDDFRKTDSAFGSDNTKGWVSGSPQSTLCVAGARCGCRQGSSNGSPNGESQLSPQPETWDLLYAAAGEVARMRMNEDLNYGRGLLGPPRKPSPISVPVRNQNSDAGFYAQSLAHKQLQVAQFQQLKQKQMMKQQNLGGAWGGPAKANGQYQQQQTQIQTQTHQMVQNRGRNSELYGSRNGRPLGLSPSAWPPLQQTQQQKQQQQQQSGSGMRAVFLGATAGKRECAGTGVFLPRRVGTPETRKKPACSTVLLPARVVQALNLNLIEMGAQPQFEPRFNGSFHDDAALRLRNSNAMAQQRRNLRPQPAMNHEIRLPQEWTY